MQEFYNIDDIIIIYKEISSQDKKKKLVEYNKDTEIVNISQCRNYDINTDIVFEPMIKIVTYNNIFATANIKINKSLRGLRVNYFDCNIVKFHIDNINKDVYIHENFVFDIDKYNKGIIIENKPDMKINAFDPIISIYFNPNFNIRLIESNEVYDESLKHIEFR
jgi:hypothetical protein